MISLSCPRVISLHTASFSTFLLFWRTKENTTPCFRGRWTLDWPRLTVYCTWKQRASRFIPSKNDRVIIESNPMVFSFSLRAYWQTWRLIYSYLCSYQNKLCTAAPDWMLKGFRKVIRVCLPKRLMSNQYQSSSRFTFDVEERLNAIMGGFIFLSRKRIFRLLIPCGEEQHCKGEKIPMLVSSSPQKKSQNFVLRLPRLFLTFCGRLMHVFGQRKSFDLFLKVTENTFFCSAVLVWAVVRLVHKV